MTLRWAAVAGAAQYELYRNGSLIGGGTLDNFTDAYVVPGTTYSYQVFAFSGGVRIASSNTVSGTAAGPSPTPTPWPQPTPTPSPTPAPQPTPTPTPAPPPAPDVVTRVVVSPGSISLAVGGTQQMVVTVYDQYGRVMSVPVSWRSSDAGVAAVNQNGVVTGFGPGTAYVAASAGDVVSSRAAVSVSGWRKGRRK